MTDKNKRIKMSIVIPSYNNIEKTRLCLKYLFMQETGEDCRFEVIIVDDCSDIVVEKELANLLNPKGAFVSVKVIRNTVNMGLAASRNVGAQNAVGDIVLFLDNDIIQEKNNVMHHVKTHESNDNTVCISRIFDVKKSNFDEIMGSLAAWDKLDSFYMKNNLETEMDPLFSMREEILNARELEDSIIWPFGAFFCTSLRRETYLKAGKFDENFKGWGPEDVDFGYRLFRNGAHFVYCNQAVCYHLDNGRKNREKLIRDISVNSRYMFSKYSRNSEIRAYLNFYKGSIPFEEFEATVKGKKFVKSDYEKLHYIGILRFIDFKCE